MWVWVINNGLSPVRGMGFPSRLLFAACLYYRGSCPDLTTEDPILYYKGSCPDFTTDDPVLMTRGSCPCLQIPVCLHPSKTSTPSSNTKRPAPPNCTGGSDVIRKEAWSFYRTISGVRLCWELEEPKGPKGPPGLLFARNGTSVVGNTVVDRGGAHEVLCSWVMILGIGVVERGPFPNIGQLEKVAGRPHGYLHIDSKERGPHANRRVTASVRVHTGVPRP